MRKRKTTSTTLNIPLDTVSAKRRRGRPPTIPPVLVRTTADNDRNWLAENWGKLKGPLLAARTEQEIREAIQSAGPRFDDFLGRVHVILSVLGDPKFPKQDKAQINFLADSIAGGEVVTPRRSRDICAKQRKADAETHHILRHEYWIACSCGYEGPSVYLRCKKCGALLDLLGSNPEIT
jgi:hypothetical protein